MALSRNQSSVEPCVDATLPMRYCEYSTEQRGQHTCSQNVLHCGTLVNDISSFLKYDDTKNSGVIWPGQLSAIDDIFQY